MGLRVLVLLRLLAPHFVAVAVLWASLLNPMSSRSTSLGETHLKQ